MKNPNPARIHDSMWWLWLEISKLDSDIILGGIYANKRGYHNTRAALDRNRPNDYSVIHPDDRKGPSDKAAAIDLTFRSAQRGDYKNIAKYSSRLLAAGKARDPRLKGWREFFGQADSDRGVEGWDFRKNRASTSDSSHLWHIHISEVRAYVESMVNKQCLLSVLKGESLEEYLKAGGKLLGDAPTPTTYNLGDRELRRGMSGNDVRQAQNRLNLHGAKIAEDGIFGPKTEAAVKAFQKAKGLVVDGIIGPKTTAALKANPTSTPPKTYNLGDRELRRGMSGNDVRQAQHRLNLHGAKIAEDGDFGPKTEAAVKAFQKAKKLVVDGIIGPKTTAALKANPTPAAPKLVVDGKLGPKTIRRWQEIMGTPADGVISNPSELVKAVQRHLNRKINARLVVDGRGIAQDGKRYATVLALQKYLGTPQDGVMSKPVSEVVKALQRRLNQGWF